MRQFVSTVGLAVCLAASPFGAPSLASAAEPSPIVDDDPALRSYYTANGLLNRGLHDLAAEEYRTFLAAHPNHEKSASARYGLGVSLFRQQKYREALAAIDAIGSSDFAFRTEAQVIKGQCAMNLGNIPVAIDTFEAVATANASHELADDATALLAESQYRADRYAEAMRTSDRLAQQWPDSTLRERSGFFGALGAMALGQWQEAAGRFESLNERYPTGENVEQATLLLAQCSHRANQLGPARRAYERVLTQSTTPWMPDALYGLGLLLYDAREPGEAAVMLDQVLTRFDDHRLADSARLLRGRIRYDAAEYEEAETLFAEIERDDSLLAESQWWLAKCDLRRDRPADAAARLDDAVTTYPDSPLRPRLLYDLAVARVRSDDRPTAITGLRDLLETHGDHELAPDATELLAFSLHQEGNYNESQTVTQRYLQRFADQSGAPAMAFLAAENEYLRERYDEAIGRYRGYLSAYPDDERRGRATFRFGMSLYAVGNYQESETPLLSVVDGDDTDEAFRPALLALGDGLFQRGVHDRAQGFLETYLANDPDPRSTDDALLKLGLARQRQEQWQPALEAYDRLLEDHPGSPHLLHATFERGQVLVSTGNDDEAAAAFRAVVADESDGRYTPWALNHLGTIALRRESWREAADLFSRASDTTDDAVLAVEARYHAGVALMTERAYEDAITTWDTLLESHPRSDVVPQAAAQRAIAIARGGDHVTALGTIESVRDDHASDLDEALLSSLSYEEAWCLRNLDRTDDATAAYERLLDRYDGSRSAVHGRLELAELLMAAERWDDATRVLAGYAGRPADAAAIPDDVREQAMYRSGVCALRSDRFDDAAAQFETMIDDFATSSLRPSASLMCGEALLNAGRHGDAVTHLEYVVDEHPDDESAGPALLRLGECHAVLQRWDASESTFARHRELFPDDELWFQSQFGVAWSRENRAEHDAAIETYQVIVDEHAGPTAARAQFQIGECLFAMERYAEAARALLRVDILYDYPEWSAAALYEAGRCFEAMNDPVQARRQYEQVGANHADTEWGTLATERLEALAAPGLPGRSSS